MNYWQKDEETMPIEEIKQVQLERLQATLNRAFENVAFYKKKFKEMGLDPSSFRDCQILPNFPLPIKVI